MKAQLSYSGLSMPLRTHEFGAADVIPKDSNLIEKTHPLGSYFRHAGIYGLSACCKRLNVGLSGIMDGHPSNIAVASMKAVRDRCFQFNLDVEHKLLSGRRPRIFLAKIDVDGFFNNVK